MINFCWIVSVVLTSVVLWLLVHPLVLPVPLFIWLVVEFIKAGREKKQRILRLEEMREEDDGRA